MEWLTQCTEWVNSNAGLVSIICGAVVLLALSAVAFANRKKPSSKKR